MTMTKPEANGLSRSLSALLLGTALTAALIGPATAETLTVTDITATMDSAFSLSVPSVTVVDGNLSESAIRTLFSTDAVAALASLATLDAASVEIPEITMTVTMPVAEVTSGATTETVTTTTTYRDFVLTDVVDGVAASASIRATEVSGEPGIEGKFGVMSTGRFDMAALLGFYGIGAGATSTEMKPVYADFHLDGGTLVTPEVSCELGPIDTGGFSARPLKYSLSDMAAASEQLSAAETAGETPPAEATAVMMSYVVDLLTAFTTEPMVAAGFTCAGKDDKGNDLTIASGPINIGGFEPAIYPMISLDDFKVDVTNDGNVGFGNFTLKPMNFASAVALLQQPGTVFDEAWAEANWRKLIPAFDGMSLSAFTMDIPDPEKEGARITASLGAFDATLGNYVNGVPADIALAVDDLLVPIPPEDGPGQELLARGITELNLDLGSTLRWNRDTSTITVDTLMVDAGVLGRIAISGTLGNATELLFGEDMEAATRAGMMLTVKDLTLEIEDRGVGALVVAAGAREAGQPESGFRVAISGMAQGFMLAGLGNSDEALAAAQALGKFLSGDASSIKLTLTAIDPAGLGMADLAAIEQDPTALAGKLTIVAEAGGEPMSLPEIAAPAASTQDEKLGLKTPPAAQ